MRNFFSKFAKLAIEKTVKAKPFAVFNDDGEKGFYVKRLKEEIKKYPKLKELNLRGYKIKKLSKVEPDDIIVFGDAQTPHKYDFRVVEIEDLRSTSGFDTYELVENFKEVKKALKVYHKANYPKDHKLLQQRSRRYYYSRRSSPSPPKYAYYSRLSGKKVPYRDLEVKLDIPRVLLGKYKNVEHHIKVEVPVTKPRRYSSYPYPVTIELPKDTVIGRKKKINKKQYVVHQNFAKVGLKAYNIYANEKGEEFVNVAGKQYLVWRRPNKKDVLLEQ
jgi:hypothetical protein